jgi:hypothetical protein
MLAMVALVMLLLAGEAGERGAQQLACVSVDLRRRPGHAAAAPFTGRAHVKHVNAAFAHAVISIPGAQPTGCWQLHMRVRAHKPHMHTACKHAPVHAMPDTSTHHHMRTHQHLPPHTHQHNLQLPTA